MSEPVQSDEISFRRNVMNSFIEIAAVVILVGYCMKVLTPFFGIVLWGVVLSVAVYPLHTGLTAKLGGRAKTSAFVIGVVGLAILLVPGWLVTESSVSSLTQWGQQMRAGTFHVSPPDDDVANWPLIGEQVYAAWSGLATDFRATVEAYQQQVSTLAQKLASIAGSLALGLVHFTASIIIAAICLLYADKGYEFTLALNRRIAPNRGQHLTDLSISTIRSVTNGVLGVAVIQAVLAGIGFAVIGLPAAGLVTLAVLIVAIVQIPAIIIMIPAIAWAYSHADPVAATIFAIYSVLAALSDNVLKPMLLGRGVDLPVLIVLLGAIGGMIQFGVVGLFIGAVILGLGYQIITDWIRPEPEAEAGTVS